MFYRSGPCLNVSPGSIKSSSSSSGSIDSPPVKRRHFFRFDEKKLATLTKGALDDSSSTDLPTPTYTRKSKTRSAYFYVSSSSSSQKANLNTQIALHHPLVICRTRTDNNIISCLVVWVW